MADLLRVACGAGFAGDRVEPAVLLAESGTLDFLVLEVLGERTVALAQLRRRKDPAAGYDAMLERRVEALLPVLKRKGARLVGNFGGANPDAAADAILAIARRLSVPVKVAVVTGDDVLAEIDPASVALESGAPIAEYGRLVSANAYLGADALLPALASGADVVVTGRVADPSLFLAPMIHRYGWALDDVDRLARGTSIGHLLECAAQVSGGYYADPGRKDVPGIAHLGFPFADVDADGNATLGKLEGTGGVIDLATVTEQLLYEVTDPTGYVTPDVVADFSAVRLRQRGRDRVEVRGARGRARPDRLKVSVGYLAGYLGEGEIGYGGENALARARLAGDIVRERIGAEFDELRIDLIGSTSLHGRAFDAQERPYEVRLRVAARAASPERAAIVGEEVEALYLNGPAGGGGARKYVHEQIGIVSTLIDRDRVRTRTTVKDWALDGQTV
ncbi:MAG TPA: acyclic terpene utilization AtuA family protein [Casimicrobiaceae bacterium]|nr:acyclic terpene utilization AtuA family protein [Casimicrobiaceae bacterium]